MHRPKVKLQAILACVAGDGAHGHADDVDDGFEGAEDGAQHVRVLLAQVLVQHDAQVTQQLLLVARLQRFSVVVRISMQIWVSTKNL